MASSMLINYCRLYINSSFVDGGNIPTNEYPNKLHEVMLKYTTKSTFGGTFPCDDAHGINHYLGSNQTTANLGYHAKFLNIPINYFIKARLHEDRPVILYTLIPTLYEDPLPNNNSNFNRHAFLAFGYKSKGILFENNFITATLFNVHSGWHSYCKEYQERHPNEHKWNDSHTHYSDLYVGGSFGGITWLEKYSNHTHDFSKLEGSTNDIKYHDVVCTGCNLLKREAHTFKFTLYENSSIGYMRCDCGLFHNG